MQRARSGRGGREGTREGNNPSGGDWSRYQILENGVVVGNTALLATALEKAERWGRVSKGIEVIDMKTKKIFNPLPEAEAWKQKAVLVVQRLTDWSTHKPESKPPLDRLRKGHFVLSDENDFRRDSLYHRLLLANKYERQIPFWVYSYVDVYEKKSKATPLYLVDEKDKEILDAWYKEDSGPLDEEWVRKYQRTHNGLFSSIFGGSKVTYRPGATSHALSAAYAAGKKFGDTGEFDLWWSKYQNKSGVDRKKAKAEFERGVEGEPSAKQEAREEKKKGRNENPSNEPKAYLWGRKAGRIVFSPELGSKYWQDLRGEELHIHWFEKMGWPTSGKEFDDIHRGVVNTYPKTKTLEITDYHGGEGWFSTIGPAPDSIFRAFKHKFPSYKGYKATNPSRVKNGLFERSAEEIAEGFHGRPVREEVEVVEEEDYAEDLAGLGLLCELEILVDEDKVVPIKFKYNNPNDAIMLTSDTEDNIEFVGGNQSLNVDDLKSAFKCNTSHKDIELGEVYSISYFADKHHLEGPKSQAKGTEYIHEFGEEGGERPVLVYDQRNKKMKLVGGSYTITDEGIRD